MRRALQLALQGRGFVEPNPPVGAVVQDRGSHIVGEGYHQRFGGPHAEILALDAAGTAARDGTLYVTLEPCCHHGKTGPCTEAVIQSDVARVVIGTTDPNPQVAGAGIARLQAAGIQVDVGMLEPECKALIAPFAKRITTGLPWVHAKWAMTLDGKIASRSGRSQWISNEASRRRVHELRGRMDAILIGAGTARQDDPLLTARPAGPRTALRVVVSRSANLDLHSQLVGTAREFPTLVTTVESSETAVHATLQAAGVEVRRLPGGISEECTPAEDSLPDPLALLELLGKRQATNVLLEGGGRLTGSFLDAGLIDELHVFVAPKLVGGEDGVTPVGGRGRDTVPTLPDLSDVDVEVLDGDVYIHGYVRHDGTQTPGISQIPGV